MNKAIERFGSQAKLAEALDVEPMAVTHWKNRGVPLKRAIQIESLTNGDISMRDLCSDQITDLENKAA